MELHLKGKRALVTGSTAGIGLAIARQLAGEGVSVIVNGRTGSRIKSAIGHISDVYPNAPVTGLVADFAKRDSVAELTGQLPQIDILVNNVGVFEPKPFTKLSDEDWWQMIEINVMSGVRLSRHILPGMLKRNWGRIIFISSESGVQIPEEMVHYGMTKTAQLAIANGLARTTKGTEVTVNSVLPGSTWSEGAEKFIGDLAIEQKKSQEQVSREFFEKVRPTCLLQRFATTDEVANLVTYLASPLSSATNGAALRVDGGTVPTIF